MPAVPTSKVQVVPVVHKLLLQTNGVDGNDVVLDVPLPSVEGWGPHTASITPHTNLEQKSANFRWKLVMYWSIDGIVWSPPVDIFANSSTAGQLIQTDFTDKTKLGLHIRFALVCSPSAGTAKESGIVTVALAFDFRA